MFPVAATIFGFPLYSYGLFIAMGYLAALWLGRSLALRLGLDPAPYTDMAFLAIVSGVVGGRIFYVIQSWGENGVGAPGLLDFWNGGFVFYGGLLLAGAVCVLYTRWKKVPLGLSADLMLTGVAFAHAFGRVGCFAAGCCYGSYCPYPWAIHSSSELLAPALKGQPIHPVQLYEAFSLFLLSALLAGLLLQRRLKEGSVALLYLAGYASIRIATELFRGDADRGFVGETGLSTSQLIALAILALTAIVFIHRLRSGGSGARGIGRNH
jgi:phosphatidylglycerol:prolipoprotein diacylglycerol transferase